MGIAKKAGRRQRRKRGGKGLIAWKKRGEGRLRKREKDGA